MKNFYESQFFFWVVVLAMGAYIAYYFYSTVKFVLKNHKVRKEYLSKHKDVKSINHYWGWVVLYGIFVAIAIFETITMDPTVDQAEWFRMAFFFVGMLLLGQIFIAIVKRRILIGEDGFVYEDSFTAWRSVLRMEPKKRKFMRIVDVLTGSNNHYMMPPSLGKILHDEYETYRTNKKNLKKEKKNGRA